MMEEKEGTSERKAEKKTIPVVGKESESVEGEGKDTDRSEEVPDQAANYLERLQRLQAEFTNYRKRIEKERERLFSIAKGDLVLKLLSVLDDLERMVDHHENDDHCSMEGVRLIYQNFKKILQNEGLKVIPAMGESFNPEIHEAVGVVKASPGQDDIILEEWQKGYQFEDRLLRPSRVKVGKADDKAGDD